ncbi:MAG: HAMP domain-containing protein [Chloroflexi bacterium]|nr:HAMP domain-containing protein [Chloroflexota bacterium]
MTLKAILALTQVAILAAGMALLGTLVVESFERTLRADADQLLSARADALEATVLGMLQTGAGDPASFDPNSPGFDAFSEPRLFFEIWDGEGRAIAASPGLPAGGLPWTDQTRAAAESGRPLTESVSVNGRRARVVTRPIVEHGRVTAVVRIGESLQAIDQAVNDLLRPLTVGSVLVLLVCIVATWLVVSRALDPLEEIAATAQRIAATGDVGLSVRPEGTAEVRRLATSFDHMIGRLRRLLDSQRQLLADTSHELRNPLTVIRTDLDLLGLDLDAETRQEVAAEAQEEAERMSRLVADLLFLSREEEAAVGDAEPVRLDRLAEEVVERLMALAPEHEVRAEDAGPVVVLGNEDRLRQLVTNLVENGIRYTPPGGHITVRACRPDERTARLEVADDGIGIPSEHLPRVFDRFYRVDPARSRATGGTGLGLSIVKHIVEVHGGSVWAESEPGVGSRFVVTLPAAPPDVRKGAVGEE